ncbi:O-antigen ligase family protein, partial [Candidatus Falkowbacteria bacterium]|nr:O-antigen ligase family protein [Candidatus Falkowbacteria bacterium]
MDNLIGGKIFRNTLLFIILAEILSFLGYYNQTVNFGAFFIIIILVLILSLYRLEYGLYVLLAELLAGSFGYLFYFEANGFKISIRVALWLIIMSVWLAKTIIRLAKTKRLELDFFRSPYLFYFLALFIFIALGAINGLLKNNSLSNIFFDFNNWLYFSLIFLFFSVLRNNNLKIIKQIFLGAIIWLGLKTIILAYVFSHNFGLFALDLYLWTRRSGLGEITQVIPGFNRIFMQSHIFVLIGFFVFLFYSLKDITDNANKIVMPGSTRHPENLFLKKILDSSLPVRPTCPAGRQAGSVAGTTKYLVALVLFLSVIIISFSRSFWLGLAAGGLFIWLAAIFKLKINFKKFIIFNSLAAASVILGLALSFFIIKFPYPETAGNFDAASLLSERATRIIGEAGASSRWQLLPPLWQKIKAAPILGQGFGATVTYKSSDPRVLAENPKGEYTTYALEWGWLDVWLKLGIFGLLAYLVLFIKIIYDGFKMGSRASLSLAAGLIVISAVNIFSPYV